MISNKNKIKQREQEKPSGWLRVVKIPAGMVVVGFALLLLPVFLLVLAIPFNEFTFKEKVSILPRVMFNLVIGDW